MENHKGQAAKGNVENKDGLSKKERRALKTQAKNSALNVGPIKQVTNVKETNIIKQAIQSNKTEPDKKTESVNNVKDTKPTSKDNADAPNKNEEKEQRRKEWEKKMAEAKIEKENKEGLSKAELKAKRREMQEAQRQAKATVKQEIAPPPAEKRVEAKPVLVKKEPKKTSTVSKVQLVHHLYVEDSKKQDYEDSSVNVKNVHPVFIKLGAQYSANTIIGSNARCLALLSALKLLINDLTTPPKQEFCRYLESTLQHCVAYLQNCRPLAVSMINALRTFKLKLTCIDTNLTDAEKKTKILELVDNYIQDDIEKAGEAISIKVNEKISNEDVILTYGCSSLIRKILLDAHKEGKQFEVIVVDGRPLLEGREMLRRLTEAGIQCTYVVINSVSFVMNSATKVLLGAHALLANGYVMSRMGTAQVALIAKAFNKPVLVCCETYKFSEKVQTDSFVYNEIGDPEKLVSVDTREESSPLSSWKTSKCLTPLNLLYDVTPPDFVTAVITELGFLPCTSVPVVLRIRPAEPT